MVNPTISFCFIKKIISILFILMVCFSSNAFAVSHCNTCGKVIKITHTEAKGKGGLVGKIGGGVAGGLLGGQIGGGSGKTVSTVIGTLGGAYVGNEVEKKVSTHKIYHVRVQLNDGSIHTVQYKHKPGLRIGQRIQYKNGRLILR